MVESGAGRYTQLTQVGRHELIADEPVSVGGGNAGPAPYDSRLPALGSSTSMTLRVVAKRKNWQLEPVEVTLKQRHVHAQDCADCASTDDQVLEIAQGFACAVPSIQPLLDITGRWAGRSGAHTRR